VIIALAAVGGVLLLILILVLLMCIFKRKRHTEPTTASSKGKAVAGGRAENPKEDYSSGVQEAERNKLVFFEGSSYNFDLEDLLRASAEVLGKGSYGTTYKAVLEDGTTVVVKRLKEVVVGKKEFEQQMEIIGRVGQHQNVVPLRAYYYSKDEKLLVFDYVPSGSLAAVLHGMFFACLFNYHQLALCFWLSILLNLFLNTEATNWQFSLTNMHQFKVISI